MQAEPVPAVDGVEVVVDQPLPFTSKPHEGTEVSGPKAETKPTPDPRSSPSIGPQGSRPSLKRVGR